MIRDHRVIAKQLDLYHMQEESPGMIFWHKNGLIIFQELKSFIRLNLKNYKYQEVRSPIMIDRSLWERTGHFQSYSIHMFLTSSDNREYCIKPMNCLGHILIFNQGIKSYRDLPIRIAEFGICHRNEPSGSLHGLMRLRNFTQDDAHIFCTNNQLKNEINDCIKMIYEIYSIFGFKNISVKLSTRPKNRIGNDEIWETAEKNLESVLLDNNIPFKYQLGDGAFYGPKIEFNLLDYLNRSWQCGTIQLDFFLPNILNSSYISENNTRKTPIMIHRAVLGSIERFIGILTEEYYGFYPTWLAPVQVVVMNITENQSNYVKEVMKELSKVNIRVELDLRNEKIGLKIYQHTLKRVPYMIICGEKEMKSDEVSVRTFRGKNLGSVKIRNLIEKLQIEIKNRNLYQLGGI